MQYLKNKVKSKLKNNKPVLGSWLNLPSLEVTEIMSKSGFEFLVIDAEHSSISLSMIQRMSMVAEGYGVFPFVRVEDNNPVVIKKALDTGCYGIITPMVNTKEDARRAVESIYYYPRGIRGVGLSRAQGYGLEFERYKTWYKANMALILQIEHIAAIDNLEDILSLQEIDATIIGPYDLSCSLGCPGRFEKKDVQDALAEYEKVSRKYGKPYGYHIVHPRKKDLDMKRRKGYKFLVYGIDEIFLREGARTK